MTLETRRIHALALTVLLAAGLPAVTAARQAAGVQTAPVNGIEMRYEIRGAGEDLVLLHGFTGCGRTWEPFAAAPCAGGRRCGSWFRSSTASRTATTT